MDCYTLSEIDTCIMDLQQYRQEGVVPPNCKEDYETCLLQIEYIRQLKEMAPTDSNRELWAALMVLSNEYSKFFSKEECLELAQKIGALKKDTDYLTVDMNGNTSTFSTKIMSDEEASAKVMICLGNVLQSMRQYITGKRELPKNLVERGTLLWEMLMLSKIKELNRLGQMMITLGREWSESINVSEAAMELAENVANTHKDLAFLYKKFKQDPRFDNEGRRYIFWCVMTLSTISDSDFRYYLALHHNLISNDCEPSDKMLQQHLVKAYENILTVYHGLEDGDLEILDFDSGLMSVKKDKMDKFQPR